MPLWNPFLIYKCLQWPWSDTHGCNRVAGMVQQPARLFKAPLSLSLRLCCYGNRHPGEHTGETSSISRVSVCKHLPQATHKTDWDCPRPWWWEKGHNAIMHGRIHSWMVRMLTVVNREFSHVSLSHMHTNTYSHKWQIMWMKWNQMESNHRQSFSLR